MRTDVAQPIRLADYRPPDYLIDTVDLDVSLDPHATRVVARLAVRPNPKGRSGADLVLDGDGLVARRIVLDGQELDSNANFVTPDQLTIAAPPQRPFTLEIETEIDPSANTFLMGLYRSGSAYCTQCEAEGFRRITYFLDRPDVLAVYTVRLEAEVSEAPFLLSNGNKVASGTDREHEPAFRDLARSLPQALLSLRSGRRRFRRDPRRIRHGVRPQSRARHLCRTWQGRERDIRDGRFEALHALGRDGLRARI